MLATYSVELSTDTNVKISTPVEVVGTYADPEGCFIELGKDTVADPVVDRVKILVCPGSILLGLIKVFVPCTNCNVKKFPVLKFIEAVFEEIDNAVTFPLVEPVTICGPVNVTEPVVA
jgi:hypothetical protein